MLKDFQVDLELSPKDNRVIQTGATYWSHDVNTAKIVVNLKRNSEPIILSSTVSVRMIMVFDDNNTQKKQVHKMTIDDTQNGVVSLILPKETLGFVGNVLCGVYVNYGENQSTDNGYFTFSMRRSLIDGEFPQLENGYVSEFQTMLDYMIEIASEFDNVEEDLNKRIDVIEKDITSNEIAKKSDVTAIDSKIDDLRIIGQNLIINSNEAKWNKVSSENVVHTSGITVNEWNTSEAINVKGDITNAGTILTLSTGQRLNAIKGKRYTNSIYIKNNTDNALNLWNNIGNSVEIKGKEVKRFTMTSDGTSSAVLQFILRSNTVNEFDFDYYHPMIEEGTRANDWGPSINDIATKKDVTNLQKQIDELKNAITTLGGTL